MSGPTAEQLANAPESVLLRGRLQLLVGEAEMAARELDIVPISYQTLRRIAAALRAAAAEATEPIGT